MLKLDKSFTVKVAPIIIPKNPDHYFHKHTQLEYAIRLTKDITLKSYMTPTLLGFQTTPYAVIEFPEDMTFKRLWLKGKRPRGKQITKWKWKGQPVYLYEYKDKFNIRTWEVNCEMRGNKLLIWKHDDVHPYTPIFNYGKPVPTELWLNSFVSMAKQQKRLNPKILTQFSTFVKKHFTDTVPSIHVIGEPLFYLHIKLLESMA
jgi:hypothetical protein